MKDILKKLLCKLFGHRYYFASQECDKVRCIDCGEWIDGDKAYGRWV